MCSYQEKVLAIIDTNFTLTNVWDCGGVNAINTIPDNEHYKINSPNRLKSLIKF